MLWMIIMCVCTLLFVVVAYDMCAYSLTYV